MECAICSASFAPWPNKKTCGPRCGLAFQRQYTRLYVSKSPITRARAAIISRDGHTCAYCGGPANTVDHIVAKSLGGPSIPSNLTAACFPCNRKKKDRRIANEAEVLAKAALLSEGMEWPDEFTRALDRVKRLADY